ncbi:cytochrome P450 [Gloeopeniophorella convolvens]|nr:cytochrome P450 [Gloeopeniophorella convolvens]
MAVMQLGAYWVEFFPWLQHVPSRSASIGQDRSQHADGPSSLISGAISPGSQRNIPQIRVIHLSTQLSSVASETMAGSLMRWHAAMLTYPETQVRAQEELGAVVGRDHLPSFADLTHLPYTHAMVKEAPRWRLSVRLGVPRGVFIPHDTLVIPSVWQCNHDPALYGADAAHVNPVRFLKKASGLVPGSADAREDGHMAYGYGRRACVDNRSSWTNAL